MGIDPFQGLSKFCAMYFGQQVRTQEHLWSTRLSYKRNITLLEPAQGVIGECIILAEIFDTTLDPPKSLCVEGACEKSAGSIGGFRQEKCPFPLIPSP